MSATESQPVAEFRKRIEAKDHHIDDLAQEEIDFVKGIVGALTRRGIPAVDALARRQGTADGSGAMSSVAIVKYQDRAFRLIIGRGAGGARHTLEIAELATDPNQRPARILSVEARLKDDAFAVVDYSHPKAFDLPLISFVLSRATDVPAVTVGRNWYDDLLDLDHGNVGQHTLAALDVVRRKGFRMLVDAVSEKIEPLARTIGNRTILVNEVLSSRATMTDGLITVSFMDPSDLSEAFTIARRATGRGEEMTLSTRSASAIHDLAKGTTMGLDWFLSKGREQGFDLTDLSAMIGHVDELEEALNAAPTVMSDARHTPTP